MNDNHLPDDDVLQLVFGELDADRQAAVRKNVAEDAKLAATVRELTAAVAAVRGENPGQVSNDFNDRLRARMSEVFDHAQPEITHPTFLTRSLTSWRWIMHSPVSRAAAAVVFVLAVTTVAFWFHSGGATLTFADFIEPILEAKTVKYKMITEMQGPPAGTTTTVVMCLGANRSRSEMELEMPNQSKLKTVHIWDGGRGKSLHLTPAEKRATIYKSANMPKDKTPNGGDPLAWLRSMLLDARDKPNVKRESLGEKDIDGHRVVGFRISLPGAVFSVWGDPKTGSPVRVEMIPAMMPNTKLTMSDFEFNVDMDESLFSVEPPADYEVTQIQNTAPDNSPLEEKDLIEMFRFYSEASGGTFPDLLDMGSVSHTVTIEEWCAANRAHPPKPMAKRQREGAEAQAKLQRGLRFAVQLPKEADSHYAGRGVSLGAADTPIFWYRPKDTKKYRIVYADLSVRDADTPPSVPVAQPAQPEQDLIEMFRYYSELSGGSFPNSLDMVSLLQMVMVTKSYSGKPQKPSAKREIAEAQAKVQRGLRFTNSLPKEADSHYAGKRVLLGAVDTPIFWYRPKDSKKYRVIYADLSVREADTSPSMPVVQPEQYLIDTFRDYSELSGGPFPDSLDLQAMTPIAGKKDQEEFTIQIFLEVYTPGKGKLEERRQKIEEFMHKLEDLQKLAPGEEKPNKEQMDKLTEQMLDLVDWEKLAPGKGKLNNEQKSKIIEARTQKVMEAQRPKLMAKLMPKISAATIKFLPGSTFVKSLPPEADAHYAGKGVSLGTADKPIFWYRPKDAKNYRVIYADLSIKDMTPDDVKKLSEAKAK